MAVYKVVKSFRDKDDKNKLYSVNSTFASDDVKRVEFLQNEGYLEKAEVEAEDAGYPKHTGGGWYELSNGEKVQGKDEASAAEEELKKLVNNHARSSEEGFTGVIHSL